MILATQQQILTDDGAGTSAVISACGSYRYLLKRPREVAHPERGAALFIMLNPSTADGSQDDPTIRRCRGFARSWQCAGLTVANLYAFRSTDPKVLRYVQDAVGPDNDAWLRRLAYEYREAVCAWGANAEPHRVAQVARIFRNEGARLWCLGTTKSGAPRHPLYVKADQALVPWEVPS